MAPSPTIPTHNPREHPEAKVLGQWLSQDRSSYSSHYNNAEDEIKEINQCTDILKWDGMESNVYKCFIYAKFVYWSLSKRDFKADDFRKGPVNFYIYC